MSKTSLRLKALMLVIAAVFAVSFVAACGDDDDPVDAPTEAPADDAEAPADDADAPADDAAGDTTTLDVPTAETGLAYAVTELTAPAGEITLSSVNDQAVPHNIAIETPDGDEVGEIVMDGGVSEITVTLEPGTYEYYCSVPGHREAGMVGTLTVE